MKTAVFSFLVLALALAAGPLQAQPWRAGGTFYGKVGAGIAEYTGDASPSGTPYAMGHFGEDTGLPYVLRGELGYQFIPQLAVGVGVETGNFPFTDPEGRLSTTRTAVQLLGRYTLGAERWRYAPYVDVGRVLTFGGVRGGHGMSVGLGVDVALTRQLSVNVETRRNVLWPDNATDDLGVGIEGVDQLAQLLGVGVKFNLKKAPVPPRVLRVDGPRTVTVGDTAAYTATINENATRPLTQEWTVGEAAVGTGMTQAHVFDAPGTYTVGVTAQNEAGTDWGTQRVTVESPPPPARIAALSATPNPAPPGQPVRFSSDVSGATPMDYQWDFGDGAVGEGAGPTHAYEAPGTYTVRLTTSNETGTDTRTLPVRVRRPSGPVAGVVTHAETGSPLLNVRVTATSAEADTTIAAEANADGTFLLTGVPTGPLQVQATKAGFDADVRTVTHTAGDTTQVDVAMTPGRETATAIAQDLREEGRRVLQNIHFETAKSRIENEFVATLQAAREVIQTRMPETQFVIEGHTDNRGSEAYNEGLSQRRADAVVAWLIDNGVAPERLEARGMGEARPIAPNDTPEGRRENRRTEIVVVGSE